MRSLTSLVATAARSVGADSPAGNGGAPRRPQSGSSNRSSSVAAGSSRGGVNGDAAPQPSVPGGVQQLFTWGGGVFSAGPGALADLLLGEEQQAAASGCDVRVFAAGAPAQGLAGSVSAAQPAGGDEAATTAQGGSSSGGGCVLQCAGLAAALHLSSGDAVLLVCSRTAPQRAPVELWAERAAAGPRGQQEGPAQQLLDSAQRQAAPAGGAGVLGGPPAAPATAPATPEAKRPLVDGGGNGGGSSSPAAAGITHAGSCNANIDNGAEQRPTLRMDADGHWTNIRALKQVCGPARLDVIRRSLREQAYDQPVALYDEREGQITGRFRGALKGKYRHGPAMAEVIGKEHLCELQRRIADTRRPFPLTLAVFDPDTGAATGSFSGALHSRGQGIYKPNLYIRCKTLNTRLGLRPGTQLLLRRYDAASRTLEVAVLQRSGGSDSGGGSGGGAERPAALPAAGRDAAASTTASSAPAIGDDALSGDSPPPATPARRSQQSGKDSRPLQQQDTAYPQQPAAGEAPMPPVVPSSPTDGTTDLHQLAELEAAAAGRRGRGAVVPDAAASTAASARSRPPPAAPDRPPPPPPQRDAETAEPPSPQSLRAQPQEAGLAREDVLVAHP
ncbi:hypothetical protein HXX76_011136 [Chlamydomonas incerta]|uniref:Uncharacterized protein n=1 Tax=Chlamydomonas incerta TaxID=51695 RepID=A0A835VY61_CHLIN|nr:hypothetical protein HXX76_011136 [Chlamydomonas incerta]|eukprot:KAG2429371.1 hypothetical protein HXX76_011136 [Chlamydomonas incerta]